KATGLESAVQWMIDEQPGQQSAVSIVAEAPRGGSSVLIERKADPRTWATQIILPSLDVQVGQTYKVSLWMKTQKPGSVSIAFGSHPVLFAPEDKRHVNGEFRNDIRRNCPKRMRNALLFESMNYPGKRESHQQTAGGRRYNGYPPEVKQPRGERHGQNGQPQ